MSKTFLFQDIQFSQTVLIQTIQFRISMQFSSIYPIDRALNRWDHSRPERTWDQWRWRSIPYYRKLQRYCKLTIRLFSLISRTLVGEVSYPSVEVEKEFVGNIILKQAKAHVLRTFNSFNHCNSTLIKILIIYLLTVKWFQELSLNMDNFIQYS